MSFIWLTAMKDWRRQRRNPAEVLVWLGIPLLIGSLIILAFGGSGGPRPQAHLLVVDEDDSFLSGLLIGALSQDQVGSVLRAEVVQREAGQRLVADGKATALLVIPPGFGTAVLQEEPTTLRLWTNPAQTILPGIVEEMLSILVDGSFYLHRLLGDELRLIAQGPAAGLNTLPDGVVAAIAVTINGVAEQIASNLTPPVIILAEPEPTADEAAEAGDDFNLGMLFVPSILLMGLLFMAQGLGADIWQEREQQTLRRVLCTPRRISDFLLGKLLAGTSMMLLVCLVGLSLGYAYFRLDARSLPLAVLWAASSGALLTALLTVIQLFATSQRAGNILTLVLVFPLGMIGGSFFPFEAMPGWMVAVGRWTPNGFALQRLNNIMFERATTSELVASWLLFAVLIALLYSICTWRLRRGFAQA